MLEKGVLRQIFNRQLKICPPKRHSVMSRGFVESIGQPDNY